MPQIENGPKGLNSILESAYASAIKSGKSKESASRIAWAAAKTDYRKKGSQWVAKFYGDLQGIVLEARNLLALTKRKQDLQYLGFPLAKLANWVKNGTDTDTDSGVEYVDIDSLLLNPYNKELDKSKIEGIKTSVNETGTVKPLIYVEVDNNGELARLLTDGHHRHEALKQMGYKSIPVQIATEDGLDSDKKELEPVAIKKEIASADVAGLDLTRQDLAGTPRRPHRRINEDGTVKSIRVISKEEMEKGGEGSGSWEGPGDPRFAWSSSRSSALRSANDHNTKMGLPEVKASESVKVDPDNARRIADAYDKMKSDPSDPKVKAAYSALGKEVDQQYKSLPVKVEFTPNDPYKSSKEMFDDVEQNKRLKVYTGGEEHPLLGQKDENGISLNDKFRAVHDYYGHAMFGHQFGPNGEENAWREHSKMFSPEAQQAMTTETRGQNSWFNYGKENEGKAIGDKKFAEQKVGILPDEFLPKSEKTKLNIEDIRPAVRDAKDKIFIGNKGENHLNVYEAHQDEVSETDDQSIRTGFVDKNGRWLSRAELDSLVGIDSSEQLRGLQHLSQKFIKALITEKLKKGGPGSGCHGPDCGRPTTGQYKAPKQATLGELKNQYKVQIKNNQAHVYDSWDKACLDNWKMETGNRNLTYPQALKLMSQDITPVGYKLVDYNFLPKSSAPEGTMYSVSIFEKELPTKKIEKGGPGSGCQGPNCGRPSLGNKAFAEPFHSGSHIQQFLGSNNVVLGSVDKSNLSPEKNATRQKEFEETLSKWNLSYKKGQGVTSEWGNETSYLIDAPRKEDAESLHHLLTRTYKQDAVVHIRNGHAVMNFNGGTNEPTKHANINGGLEAGDHLTDNYTNIDGQKFRVNFK